MIKQAVTALKGMAMGFADVIPGVSGGTIALILGIYVSFIEGIKSLNLLWVAPFFAWAASGFSKEKRQAFLEPFLSIHWGFLIPLGIGIVFAFALGSVVVPGLMDRFPTEMNAFFIGLILASTIVPFQQMKERGAVQVVALVAAALITYVAIGAKTEPALTWHETTLAEDIDFEHYMRTHPSLRTAEELYCPVEGEGDNAALREALASSAEHADAGAHLDSLCVQLDELRGDMVAYAAFRDAENLGRKHEANPFNTVTVPAGTLVQIPRPALWYIFVTGLIGICAMVLPGVSGSFFLLVLGVYHFMLSSALKGFVGALIDGQLPLTQAPYVAVFCAGCLIGLLSFARVMSALFARAPSTTLAALLGLMLGSLRALWPFKIGEPHTGMVNVMPPMDGTLVGPLVALVVGAGLVIALTLVGGKSAADPEGA